MQRSRFVGSSGRRGPGTILTMLVGVLGLGLALASPASAGNCSGVSAFAAISSTNYQVSTQRVLADGTWSVSGGADEVHLRYLIGSTLFQSENKPGTAGSWSFIDDFQKCGDHTFKVCAVPRECSGGCTTCWEHQTCKTKSFSSTSCSLTMSALSCSWTCSGFEVFGAECTGSCSVTASGGVAPYRAEWRVNGSFDHVQSSSTGSFTLPQLDCLSGDSIRVDVTDDNMGSGVQFTTCGFPRF